MRKTLPGWEEEDAGQTSTGLLTWDSRVQFGIRLLICGCNTIPNVVYFHSLSVTLLGQEKGEAGRDPKPLESRRLPDSRAWSTEGVGGGRKRRSSLVLEKHSGSPGWLWRQEQLGEVAPAASPRDNSQLREGRTLPCSRNVGVGPWRELAPGATAALASPTPFPPGASRSRETENQHRFY